LRRKNDETQRFAQNTELRPAYLAGFYPPWNARFGRFEPHDRRGWNLHCKPLEPVASVASFFLSRIDTLVDSMLEKIAKEGGPRAETAKTLIGKTAIGCAKKAYHIYKEVFDGERFQGLADRGARTQRLLWASTSAKNPAYSDVKYVEPLIGPETINTLPLETLEAFRDNGRPSLSLEENFWEYATVLDRLGEVGVKLDAVAEQLEEEGIRKFVEPYDHVMSVLEERCTAVVGVS